MTLTALVIVYALVGCGVAMATFLGPAERGWFGRTLQVATAFLFWPLELPILLARVPNGIASQASASPDSLALAIDRVDRELEHALTGLDGWAEDVLERERPRLAELRQAWRAQAQRVREIDALLADASREPVSATADAEVQQSEAARLANFERLAALRRQVHADLLATLAWVRELVSMVHLARFTGASSKRAGELVAQIAAAIEGLSRVAIRDGAGDGPASPARRSSRSS